MTQCESVNQLNFLQRGLCFFLLFGDQDLGEFQLLVAWKHCDRPEKKSEIASLAIFICHHCHKYSKTFPTIPAYITRTVLQSEAWIWPFDVRIKVVDKSLIPLSA